MPAERLTGEVFDLLMGMVSDRDESWWVVDEALQAVSRCSPEMIAPHVDTLLPYLEHEEWWLRNSAIMALTPVATDDRFHKKIFPVLGKVIVTNQRAGVLGPVRGIVSKLKDASAEVQQAAAEMLGQAYAGYPDIKRAAGGADIAAAFNANLDSIASRLAEAPGGFDALFTVAQKRFPNESLPHRNLYLANDDPSRFGPKVKKALAPIIMNELISEYIAKNRVALLSEARWEKARRVAAFPQARLSGLADLYRDAGVDDYDWHLFGPNLRDMEWEYHIFDPIPQEQVHWDRLISRFRKVTYPAGMENWFAVDFDSAKAGWKTALPPFGQYNGKMQEKRGKCRNSGCVCGDATRTFWDKEVLLIRGTFEFPPLKEGHRYRIRVGSGDHVGAGDGYAIYVNGKQFIEYPRCPGRGQGAKPRGGFIYKEFAKDFRGGKVVIAATSFLRFNSKYKVRPTRQVPQGRFSLWLEEMKMPPLGPAEMLKSAGALPMLSTKWQETLSEEDKFKYDGAFVANPRVSGRWKTIGEVKAIDEFSPAKRMSARGARLTGVTFKRNGETDEMLRIWSGDTFMDLAANSALKMTVKKVDGADYLFIEKGGFSNRSPKGWKPPFYVLRRAAE